MSLQNIFTMIKADRYTEDGCEELNKAKKEIEDARRFYKLGEISEKTGLQKQPDGGWALPKGAQQGAKKAENIKVENKTTIRQGPNTKTLNETPAEHVQKNLDAYKGYRAYDMEELVLKPSGYKKQTIARGPGGGQSITYSKNDAEDITLFFDKYGELENAKGAAGAKTGEGKSPSAGSINRTPERIKKETAIMEALNLSTGEDNNLHKMSDETIERLYKKAMSDTPAPKK